MDKCEIIKFKDNDFELDVNVSLNDETIWMTQEEISLLYNKSQSTISVHIKNIMLSGILDETTSIGFSDKTNHRPAKMFNLDIILAVGVRVKNNRGLLLKELLDNYLKEKRQTNSDIIIYNNGNLNLTVNVSPKEETVWLSVNQIASLFDTSTPNVYMHIKNIYDDGELGNSVTKDFLATQKESTYFAADGKQYSTTFYNLDVILAVGYRVKGKRAIEFRKWASNVLKQYLLKGYVIDNNRVTISKENFIQLENDISYLKKEVEDIKEKTFIEPVKERLFSDGQYFDAYEFLCSLVAKAEKCITLIDPYFDLKALRIMKKVNKDINVTVCLSKNSDLKRDDIIQFEKQYYHIKVVVNNKFHDRFLVIDEKQCYSIGTSLNHAGKRIFVVNKMEDPELIRFLLNRVNTQSLKWSI